MNSLGAIATVDGNGKGENGRKLHIRPHSPKDAGNTGISSQYLVVSYMKDIVICNTTVITDPTIKLISTHHWLHEMYTRTYSHPQSPCIRPSAAMNVVRTTIEDDVILMPGSPDPTPIKLSLDMALKVNKQIYLVSARPLAIMKVYMSN